MEESNYNYGPEFQVQCDLVRAVVRELRDALGPGVSKVTIVPLDRDVPRFTYRSATPH